MSTTTDMLDQWDKALVYRSNRYLVKEEFTEYRNIRQWVYHYSDGTTETVTVRRHSTCPPLAECQQRHGISMTAEIAN
jgi:hypothetical protein